MTAVRIVERRKALIRYRLEPMQSVNLCAIASVGLLVACGDGGPSASEVASELKAQPDFVSDVASQAPPGPPGLDGPQGPPGLPGEPGPGWRGVFAEVVARSAPGTSYFSLATDGLGADFNNEAIPMLDGARIRAQLYVQQNMAPCAVTVGVAVAEDGMAPEMYPLIEIPAGETGIFRQDTPVEIPTDSLITAAAEQGPCDGLWRGKLLLILE